MTIKRVPTTSQAPRMDKQQIIEEICQRYNHDSARMLDILWAVQDQLGWISPDSMSQIAECTGTYRVEVEGIATFYAFYKTEPQGEFIIHLCDDIIDQQAGFHSVRSAAEETLGIKTGETSSDGLFSLHLTPCIGMCDQAPAALINGQVFTHLTASKIKSILRNLKKNKDLEALPKKLGDGNNAHPLVRSMVRNNIQQTGEVLLGEEAPNQGLLSALRMKPDEVIETVIRAGLRGRGGAGYAAATKWRFAAQTPAEERYVICNADEGEPGTFKDRVLLTERAHTLIEGMTIAAYAIGSECGILYLRAEYRYLHSYLESILQERREAGYLGQDILIDTADDCRFSFDIRIQLGAGAYICGEESSLISSCEGKRGEPKNKPPFPAEKGYKGHPTIVNNVETFCSVPPILNHGDSWFRSIGTKESSGTKLLSVCGDCSHPGIYEITMGTRLSEVLKKAGAKDPEAIQVGGASGTLIGKTDFERKLCFEDLPTAGAIMVFSRNRNILDIVNYFMKFFIDESCGYCTPCRVGNVFMQQCLEKIMKGQGEQADLDYLVNLGRTVAQTSRCGLGHTSPNPILTSMKSFPLVYAALLKEHPDGRQAGFNIQAALDESRIIAKRRSIVFDPNFGD